MGSVVGDSTLLVKIYADIGALLNVRLLYVKLSTVFQKMQSDKYIPLR